MESLTANLLGRTRRVSEGGRDYIVAPLTLIVPGVLNGSKGPLFYPHDEIARSQGQWNHVPLVVYHPHDPITNQPLSAKDHGVIEKQGVGEVRNVRIQKHSGKLQAEGWFDVTKTGQVDKRVLQNLLANRSIELSTGLFTDNEDAMGNYRGRQYTAIARNYRADHLAILPDQVGACSIQDGCGVLVNSQQKSSSSLQEKLAMLTMNLSQKLQAIVNCSDSMNRNDGLKTDSSGNKVVSLKGKGIPTEDEVLKEQAAGGKVASPAEKVTSKAKAASIPKTAEKCNDCTLNKLRQLADNANNNPEGCNQYKDCGGGDSGESDKTNQKTRRDKFSADGESGWSMAREVAGKNAEGHAYVIFGTMAGIKQGKSPNQAFFDASENENYHGDRSDIKVEREQIADKLRRHLGVSVKPHWTPGSKSTHNQQGDQTMVVTLNASERKTVVDGLIGNDCCFEESEREVLNSLSDKTLARLTLTRNAAMVVKDEGDGGSEDTEEDDEAGLGVRAGAGTGPNEAQADGNVPAGGAELDPKYKETQKVQNQTAVLNAEDQEVLNYGRQAMRQRRQELVATITANARNPFGKTELASMPMAQLEKLARLAETKPAGQLNVNMQRANYFGSAVPLENASADDGTDDDFLPLPTMNYKRVNGGAAVVE